jgi:hypothetical protein
MAVSATRTIIIAYSGDVVGNESIAAVANSTSPGSITLHSLTTNTNTIAVPVSGVTATRGMTIVPPSANTQALTLKSTTADVGFALSPSEPSSIALGTTAPTNIILNAGGVIDGLRIFWT